MKRHCTQCGSSNCEKGFIPDQTHGGLLPSLWAPGVPKTNWFFGIIIKKPAYEVVTYRCSNCGHLDMYAPGNGPEE